MPRRKIPLAGGIKPLAVINIVPPALLKAFFYGEIIRVEIIMKKLLLFLFIGGLFIPALVRADGPPPDVTFRARVMEIIAEDRTTQADGTVTVKQDLKLKALDGPFAGQEIEFDGTGNIDVLNKQVYRVGDRVLMIASYDADGNVQFYVEDFVRTPYLWLLAGLFLLVLLAIGRFKGLRALIALAASFIVIVKYIIPQVLAGSSPLAVTLIGSIAILLIIIYVTEGWRARSHLSVASIVLSLVLTVFISNLFVALARLTGAASENVLFLYNIGGITLNLQGLLLAGIIIGTLGVLDDVVISQVATVEQLSHAQSSFSAAELFKRGYRVGVSHIASMANTLFLAYAGVSLPLLILFISGQSAFASWQQALNTELIATEIVRTLAGSIGLIMAVPISTIIASWWFGRK